MKHYPALNLVLFFISFSSCKGQETFGTDQLVAKETTVLPGVKGRIDHLAVNLENQLVYLAALGNNSLEIIDIRSTKLLHSVNGLSEPQGVIYVPETNEVMVANGGNGSCLFFNTHTLKITAKVDLGSDADDVRYDPNSKRIYVGYGEGGIAVIDAIEHKKVLEGKLPAHPEGFQLDTRLSRLFVNVPGADKIVVLSLADMKLMAEWKTEFKSNFPMAIDEKDHILFIGYRRPGKLVAINEMDGKTISVIGLINDVDDLYFDTRTSKVYGTGGGGAINVFSFNNQKLEQVANIPTREGARTSLLIPELNLFVLAERSNGSQVAQAAFFSLKK